MSSTKFTVLAMLLSCFSASALAQGKLVATYLEPEGKTEQSAKSLLVKSNIINLITESINQEFTLAEGVNIIIGAEDGPLYDPSVNEIWLPYAFVEETKQRFKSDNYSQTGVSAEDATVDSIAHTLLHEFGHAFIGLNGLPIVGKEEDAVDSLAVILLTQFFEQGGEMAISAADLFDLEGAAIEQYEEADFWGEHSLDIQRYYSTVCHVYGSDPSAHKYIVEADILPEDKAEQCIDDYELATSNWMALLEPYLKN